MGAIKRPKLDIPKTRLEWLFDIIGYIALASIVVILVLNWGKLPDEVPVHFGVNGEADRWGSKFELLILPGIAILLTIFMTVLEKRPETHNFPSQFNESNAEAFYTNSRQTMNYIKNIINVLFAYTVYHTVDSALGADTKLGWPFYVLLALIFIVIIWKMVKMNKIK